MLLTRITTLFEYLLNDNSSKEKTKIIDFEKFEMSKYIFQNRSTSLYKIVFGARSGTLDMEWNMWKYEDNICVKCEIAAETTSHFRTCSSYGKESYVEGWKIFFKTTVIFSMKLQRK